LGTNGQSKQFPFSSQYQAENYIRDKARLKRRKGYDEVEDKIYDLHVFRGTLVGAGAKIDRLCWVKLLDQNPNSRGSVYEEMTDVAAMANPNYEPTIFARIKFTGNRGEYSLIITLDSVKYSPQAEWSVMRQFNLADLQEDLQEITEQSPKILRNLKEKADGMVQSLL
jgi:hypothetical protein